jgi:dihydroneopterin aldolase/D-erythro-7,8-dihydroneopterin triphosphate epimerase
MDCIYIRDLSLRCIIGIFPEERNNKQDVIINATLFCKSHTAAAASDDIKDAVDYKTITKKIIDLVEPSDFQLIETMAERIAEICLAHARVLKVTISVDKPHALRFARSVAVEINREQGNDHA